MGAIVGDKFYINITATTGTYGTYPSANGQYYVEVIHADTLQMLDDTIAGSFTGAFNITVNEAYTNATALGYNAEPTASNQATIGNANLANGLKIPAYGSGAVDAAQVVETASGYFAEFTTDGTIIETEIPLVQSGTYALTVTSNQTATITGEYGFYTRIGDIVDVTVEFVVSSANALDHFISIPLPIASNLTSDDDCTGVATVQDDVSSIYNLGKGVYFAHSSGTDKAGVYYTSQNTGDHRFAVQFKYIIQ